MGRCPLTTQDSFDARPTRCFRRVERRRKKIDSSSMRILVCSTFPCEKARPSMLPPRWWPLTCTVEARSSISTTRRRKVPRRRGGEWRRR
ncbi:hypothetical protein NGA_0166500 [Nannochloropsis gaditana CCMP526]|uniref:uncharacterized protein n=1 Tax=Nannochloropsis gaditana (strain CCMP526) TaxID=1093141 RepID=UPI00029F5B43|nr:hypothetical protein NGA_0166500 [Nannochloropsis gaditana CCMP526]EKU22206.1 hypothetical protein NGA_0166500 [Nannochloropsis gaditana CCMP526]|eukprot:XP_005854154.1 hypothetical protein NGA_0166500 [Nannochloropsis gaditana CCMP526]